jgi:DNA polymerase III gamma/tau subunit
MKTYKEVSDQLLDLFTLITKEDGKQVICFTEEALEDTHPLKDIRNQLTEIIRTANLNNEYAYDWTVEALELLHDLDPQNEEKLQDALHEFENNVDIYTSDLTAWLADSSCHLDYVTQVLNEYYTGPADDNTGYNLIAYAQREARREHATNVFNFIAGLTNE